MVISKIFPAVQKHLLLFFSNGISCLDDGWAPPTGGTSDYFNTCDYIGGDGELPEVPMPIPSGEGAVGFISSSLYYEGIGVCLDNSMIAGETYNLSFHVGFNSNSGFDSPLDITINMFGTANCTNFPLEDLFSVGCLSTYGGWEVISGIPVLGEENNSWLLVETTITPTFNAAAIAFGLECTATNNSVYHFLDNIILNGNFLIETPEEELISSGNCIDGISVELPNPTGSQFQWYLDGVAIEGATTNPYLITDANAEGAYQVLVTNGPNCTISNPIDIEIDPGVLEIEGVITDVTCITNNDGMINITSNSDNDPYQFQWSDNTTSGEILIAGPGEYTVTVTDDNGCFGSETFIIPVPQNIDAIITGDCINGVFISVDDNIPGAMYQWFLDGNLIPGAITNENLRN